MKKEIQICDSCGTRIYESGYIKNDGSFQENSVKIKNQDFCMGCFGKISLLYFRDKKINLEKVGEFSSKLQPLNKRTNLEQFLNLDEFYIKFNEAKLENSYA